MLSGNLYLSEQPRWYPKILRDVLALLNNTDLDTQPLGRHDIDGENLFYVLMEYETAPKTQIPPETHREYFDVQLVVSGQEYLGWAPLTSDIHIATAYNESRDVQYYEPMENTQWLIGTAGQFYLFGPDDIHQPGVIYQSGSHVRKLVVKIHHSKMTF